ncbi:alanine--tRNA ligase [Candidatus Falkowbacteria bacterium]|nr:alanine--tRNA ligase [Candidatus Falkowbacteria bacterium]
MTANELRQKYLDFFKSKGHSIIPSASLVPRETDASTLFTTAGMHPLVPYLLGEEHPGGKRVADVQKCVRTGDIDDVGDNRHCTFFEMMGNWSFGDYFKDEAIAWSFEFLTDPKWLGLDPKRLYVTTFKGEGNIPRDEKAIEVWQKTFNQAGMVAEIAADDQIIKDNIRIIPLGTDDNFWIAGTTGPCGGDTEMFYDTKPEDGPLAGRFTDLVDSHRLMEIWNDVFMEFNKTADGQYIKLEKPNVDTGMGVERTLMVMNGETTVFETELFQPIFNKLSEISGKQYGESEEVKKSFRIIADHIKASAFMIADGVTPSNASRGYVLRRLLRRAMRYAKLLGIETDFTRAIAETVIAMYGHFYTELKEKETVILEELTKEEHKFRQTLENGIKEFEKIANSLPNSKISGDDAFNLYQSYGFPLEITKELARERGFEVNDDEFATELAKHQELSRTASAGMFKGGLQDTGDASKKLHTATHLTLAALRKVLGNQINQKGSNITPERLRLDFNHPDKMTAEQLAEVERLVNEAIGKDLPVSFEEMTVEEAKKKGAVGVFESKYGEKVKVYTVGQGDEIFSMEICGGPHVDRIGILGKYKIQKEESSSAGVRRIKAVLE